MNEIERQAIRESFTKLTHSLDPLYIRGFLYEKGVLTNKVMRSLYEIKATTLRAEEFILAVEPTCPFSLFLEALNKDRGYSFLVQELEAKVDEIKRRSNKADDETMSATDSIPGPLRRVNIHTRRHATMVKYRHHLKKICMGVNTDKFMKWKNNMLQVWKTNKHREDVSISKKQEYADLYFYALDSEIEFRRVRYDMTLVGDCVFRRMKNIIPHTTHPKLSSMIYFARKASSMHMGGKSAEKSLSYLCNAKEHGECLTPCRETGIVLIIEFNLLCHVYEKYPTVQNKDRLLKLSRNAIEHFDRESDKEMNSDFRRILLLKSTFIYLAIGLFGDYIKGVEISQYDLTVAKNCLTEVKKPQLWSRIEPRWLMIYHMAKSKIHQLEDRKDLAYKAARKASDLALQGGLQKELPIIQASMEELVSSGASDIEYSEINLLDEFKRDYLLDTPAVTVQTFDLANKKKHSRISIKLFIIFIVIFVSMTIVYFMT